MKNFKTIVLGVVLTLSSTASVLACGGPECINLLKKERISVGVQTMVDRYTTYRKDAYSVAGTGIGYGKVVKFRVCDKFSLESGINYRTVNYNTFINTITKEGNTYNGNYQVSYSTIEVPMVGNFKLLGCCGTSIGVRAGASVNYALCDKSYYGSELSADKSNNLGISRASYGALLGGLYIDQKLCHGMTVTGSLNYRTNSVNPINIINTNTLGMGASLGLTYNLGSCCGKASNACPESKENIL
ncbi:MAG: hypothetical protein SGJ04_03440 [Bacteroidota bacterium]|nr:hypothetical protein [Bacteroidota bacterium]